MPVGFCSVLVGLTANPAQCVQAPAAAVQGSDDEDLPKARKGKSSKGRSSKGKSSKSSSSKANGRPAKSQRRNGKAPKAPRASNAAPKAPKASTAPKAPTGPRAPKAPVQRKGPKAPSDHKAGKSGKPPRDRHAEDGAWTKAGYGAAKAKFQRDFCAVLNPECKQWARSRKDAAEAWKSSASREAALEGMTHAQRVRRRFL